MYGAYVISFRWATAVRVRHNRTQAFQVGQHCCNSSHIPRRICQHSQWISAINARNRVSLHQAYTHLKELKLRGLKNSHDERQELGTRSDCTGTHNTAMEPAYAFTIPSIEDDTKLDCRIYYPIQLLTYLSPDRATLSRVQGAVIAHPYAPLGGSYDDAVVLAITSRLVKDGYFVATFNFRGAGGSDGSTSWSARGEKADYMTLIGFMINYLSSLKGHELPVQDMSSDELTARADTSSEHDVQLLLAGYSYGSLILSRLPPFRAIIQRFHTVANGTSPAEVILRARSLALETVQSARDLQLVSMHGRASSAPVTPPSPAHRSRAHSATVKIGGEETDSSERRLSRGSRESRRTLGVMKKGVEVPHRIRMHIRPRSSGKSQDGSNIPRSDNHATPYQQMTCISIRYLLVSPLLPPLAHTLVPPSQISHIFGNTLVKDVSTGFGRFEHATLMVWGTEDGFTSSKKLEVWVNKCAETSLDMLKGVSVESAGHFWREPGVMKQLLNNITAWNEAQDG